jgi:hypothetical protein
MMKRTREKEKEKRKKEKGKRKFGKYLTKETRLPLNRPIYYYSQQVYGHFKGVM